MADASLGKLKVLFSRPAASRTSQDKGLLLGYKFYLRSGVKWQALYLGRSVEKTKLREDPV